MAEKKGFDLAAKLRGVSNLNTREQIEYLPFELLDRDPDNFYSLDGISELADSIAAVGLVHPLRVRPAGERYTVTSGHRRRAAIQLLINSGEDWSAGVPCIVDRGESTPEFNELKLIFANNQRQKTSAELSREAERTEELIVALKEKGFEFPGRMQDHVAQVMGVHASKLKRLHAIRANLAPEMLALFDAGKLNEEAAYQLQQLPKGVQVYLAAQKKVQTGGISGVSAKTCVERCDKYLHPTHRCPGGDVCKHTLPRFYQTAVGTGWATCRGECCLKCSRSFSDCPYRCKRAKQAHEEQKADDKASKARAEAERKKLYDENRAVLAGQYAAYSVLAKAAGLQPDEEIFVPGARTVADLAKLATDPSQLGDYKARQDRVFDEYTYVGTIQKCAEQFGVSVDFLLGRTEEPAVNRGEAARAAEDDGPGGEKRAAEGVGPYEDGGRQVAAPTEAGEIVPRWIPGAPEEPGRYMCLLRGNADGPEEPDKEFRVDVKEDGPYLFDRPMLRGYIITAHWPLPELPGKAVEP